MEELRQDGERSDAVRKMPCARSSAPDGAGQQVATGGWEREPLLSVLVQKAPPVYPGSPPPGHIMLAPCRFLLACRV